MNPLVDIILAGVGYSTVLTGVLLPMKAFKLHKAKVSKGTKTKLLAKCLIPVYGLGQLVGITDYNINKMTLLEDELDETAENDKKEQFENVTKSIRKFLNSSEKQIETLQRREHQLKIHKRYNNMVTVDALQNDPLLKHGYVLIQDSYNGGSFELITDESLRKAQSNSNNNVLHVVDSSGKHFQVVIEKNNRNNNDGLGRYYHSSIFADEKTQSVDIIEVDKPLYYISTVRLFDDAMSQYEWLIKNHPNEAKIESIKQTVLGVFEVLVNHNNNVGSDIELFKLVQAEIIELLQQLVKLFKKLTTEANSLNDQEKLSQEHHITKFYAPKIKQMTKVLQSMTDDITIIDDEPHITESALKETY